VAGLVSWASMIRRNELEVWLVAEHVVDMPLVHAV
jgi:hypothetical protein